MRVVTGGISHETSTFTPVATNLQSYAERFYLHELDILNIFRGTNTPIGGFIAGAERARVRAHSHHPCRCTAQWAHPSGHL